MKPLAGIRILTLEQFGAAPYGSMFLADLGAEVIKIENASTGGDPSRSVGPHMLGKDSQYFHAWNTNKKSVALDIKTAEGRSGFNELVTTADAVMNNLRGDQAEKLGIHYQSLKEFNERIVCLHISAYGRTGSRKAWPGYDFLMQAEAGLMSLSGDAASPPARMGVSIIDYMTGVTGIVGLLSCLLRARSTGVGCDVDVSLFDVALHQLGYSAVWYLNEGTVSQRQPRNAHLSLAPVQLFPTADGWIFVMCMNQKFWERLTEAIGRPELKSDSRFATQSARLSRRDELTAVLDGVFGMRSTQEWLDALSGVLPVSPIYDIDTALDSEFVKEAGMVTTVPHPERPDLRMLANPLLIDGERPAQSAAPTLGQHDGILRGTNY
jgi:crotonobetainyl-CoA:carnitine CoA-transferase CaiB-like acyl-CoA transferase